MTLAFAPERIEMWPLAKLQPYAKNAKVHGADQVAKIASSTAEFGWTAPCLVAEDGEVIAGHGHVLAATQLGPIEAPVIVLGHLTEVNSHLVKQGVTLRSGTLSEVSQPKSAPRCDARFRRMFMMLLDDADGKSN